MLCGIVGVSLLLAFSSIDAQAKLIRLRTQVIPPRFARTLEAPKKSGPEAAASGLFLIQFKGPLSQESRAQLAASGVDLLHYVPEDTFLARLHGTRLDLLRAFPFVEWIGEYRPELKVHRALQSKMAAQRSNEDISAAILMVPHASPAEIAKAPGALSKLDQESNLRSGTVLRGKI